MPRRTAHSDRSVLGTEAQVPKLRGVSVSETTPAEVRAVVPKIGDLAGHMLAG